MSLHTNFPHVGAAIDRHLAKRWCLLAETRLAYLTELFETGRWRRFHSETEFLDNIQEAKDAVDRWRAMAKGEIGAVPLARGSVLYEAPRTPESQPVSAANASTAFAPIQAMPTEAKDAPLLIPIEKLLRQAPPRDFARRTAPFSDVTVSPADLEWEKALDPITINERYPMLRTAM